MALIAVVIWLVAHDDDIERHRPASATLRKKRLHVPLIDVLPFVEQQIVERLRQAVCGKLSLIQLLREILPLGFGHRLRLTVKSESESERLGGLGEIAGSPRWFPDPMVCNILEL